MSVPAAYLTVILIWSTTPLAIQWSLDGGNFLLALTARMAIGVVICFALLKILKIRMPLHRDALETYLAAGLSIFGAMFCVYWGARYIPSGLIALLFGLQPMIISIFAAIWLGERGFTPNKVLGMLLGLTGLATIFGFGFTTGTHSWAGIGVVLIAVIVQSVGLVWVKRIGAKVPALAITSGALTLVLPLCAISWAIFDGVVPVSITPQAGWAMVYLGVFGSVVGFNLYFYLIKQLEAGQLALITLMTPVLALSLGRILNGEKIEVAILLGAACILGGLVLHQWQALAAGLQRELGRR